MPGPLVSGVASLIAPGLGQILNKKFLRGIVVFCLFFIGATFLTVFGLIIFVPLFLPFIAYDAYKVAKGSAGMVP